MSFDEATVVAELTAALAPAGSSGVASPTKKAGAAADARKEAALGAVRRAQDHSGWACQRLLATS
jgi:hypothetical protein